MDQWVSKPDHSSVHAKDPPFVRVTRASPVGRPCEPLKIRTAVLREHAPDIAEAAVAAGELSMGGHEPASVKFVLAWMEAATEAWGALDAQEALRESQRPTTTPLDSLSPEEVARLFAHHNLVRERSHQIAGLLTYNGKAGNAAARPAAAAATPQAAPASATKAKDGEPPLVMRQPLPEPEARTIVRQHELFKSFERERAWRRVFCAGA